MDELLSSLKAAAEITRIRILFALSHGELNVTELTQILDQSQPRVSRHLKLMLEAKLIARHKEGNWVVFRQGDEGISGRLAGAVLDLLAEGDPMLEADLRRVQDIKAKRAEVAAAYFAANAHNWEKLRSLQVDETQVEKRICELIGQQPVETLVDLGTGTGRMMELFVNQARRLIGIDLSREMLSYARANMDRLKASNAQVRQASLYSLPLPDKTADVILLHQVLHFLDEPAAAVREAARILKPLGKLLIVDFAPHNQDELRELNAHRRLGLAQDQIARWLAQSGLETLHEDLLLPPSELGERGLKVTIILATRPLQQEHSLASGMEAA
jgi:ubiquinone/menaquinone biosynthesis C-methylase UbiE/DNA-binding transcriptional ArsR family regulator